MTPELRTCRKCGRTLPVHLFPPDQRSRYTGLLTHCYTCRECSAYADLRTLRDRIELRNYRNYFANLAGVTGVAV